MTATYQHDGQITKGRSIPSRKKILIFSSSKSVYIPCIPSRPEGRRPTSRTWGGDAVDVAARETGVLAADGQIVWTGHRDAGVKLALRRAGDGGKRAQSRRGE